MSERIQTHWDQCWRSRSHWRCAAARVEALEAELAKCREACRRIADYLHPDQREGWIEQAYRTALWNSTPGHPDDESSGPDADVYHQLDQCQKQRDSLKVENAELEKRLWDAGEGNWPFEWQVATRLREKLKECLEELERLREEDRVWDKHSLVEIVEERNELREALAECQRQIPPFGQATVENVMTGLKRELAECREALAAAEARERVARTLIREADKNARPGGLMDRILSGIDNALQSNYAALAAYVEEWREEVVRLEIESEKRRLENRELERKLEQERWEWRTADEAVKELRKELAECREALAAAKETLSEGYGTSCQECWQDVLEKPGVIRFATVFLCEEHYAAALVEARYDCGLGWFGHFVEYLDMEVSQDDVQWPKETIEEGIDAALEQARAEERERCAHIAESMELLTHCDMYDMRDAIADAIREADECN